MGKDRGKQGTEPQGGGERGEGEEEGGEEGGGERTRSKDLGWGGGSFYLLCKPLMPLEAVAGHNISSC